jgi:S1-C subfamily serine protease
MATPSGFSGGHSFIAAGNFNGCNTTGCHSSMSASNGNFTSVQTEIADLLAQLAAKINEIGVGHDILQKDPEDNQYHGNLNIYDSNSNSTGYWKNPANGSPALPALTNAQFGALLNYQLVVRDGSLGVHNYPYIKKLLENTIAAI